MSPVHDRRFAGIVDHLAADFDVVADMHGNRRRARNTGLRKTTPPDLPEATRGHRGWPTMSPLTAGPQLAGVHND